MSRTGTHKAKCQAEAHRPAHTGAGPQSARSAGPRVSPEPRPSTARGADSHSSTRTGRPVPLRESRGGYTHDVALVYPPGSSFGNAQWVLTHVRCALGPGRTGPPRRWHPCPERLSACGPHTGTFSRAAPSPRRPSTSSPAPRAVKEGQREPGPRPEITVWAGARGPCPADASLPHYDNGRFFPSQTKEAPSKRKAGTQQPPH